MFVKTQHDIGKIVLKEVFLVLIAGILLKNKKGMNYHVAKEHASLTSTQSTLCL